MQSNLINTECCLNNNIKAQIAENIYICLYDVLELHADWNKDKWSSRFKRYLSSSEYGQKNSGPHNIPLPVGLWWLNWLNLQRNHRVRGSNPQSGLNISGHTRLSSAKTCEEHSSSLGKTIVKTVRVLFHCEFPILYSFQLNSTAQTLLDADNSLQTLLNSINTSLSSKVCNQKLVCLLNVPTEIKLQKVV